MPVLRTLIGRKTPKSEAPLTYWRVVPRTGEDGTPDIDFQVVAADCPQEQRDLKAAVEQALTIVKALYSDSDDSTKLREAVTRLTALSQVGLVGQTASPTIAADALRALEAEITARESGPIKNAYMRRLGTWAAAYALLAIGAYFFCHAFPTVPFEQVTRYRMVFLVWAGCMAGAWASFATRKVALTFGDLVAIEDDKIEPQLRLLFTGVLTIILSLIFLTGAADVEIGNYSAADLRHSGAIAVLTGAFAGMAEKALPSAVLARAEAVIASTRSQ